MEGMSSIASAIIGITFILLFIGLIVVGIIGTIDILYFNPVASEKANQVCQEQGFDFYESFSRIGILSKVPVAVKCKYVEQYRNVDLNINKNGAS